MRLFFHFVFFLSLSVSGATARADETNKAAEYRGKIREWVISHVRHALPTIAPEANDSAADLVDELRYTKLSEMESASLLASHLEVSPWSGSYWPTYAGSIANRYGDPNYNAALIWKYNETYLTQTLGKGRDEQLSPAEKYDMLVGDSKFTLTNTLIQASSAVADAEGKVPTWFGICHGWAPASFMMPRPELGVTATTAEGKEIFFTPTDLKALASLLWANGEAPTRFVGSRCNDTTPDRDPNFRETNPDCFDTNPATWHLAVVNQIGVSHRSFVLDASAGAEVWNQPVYGYQYGYINPITNKSYRTLADAKVKLKDWSNDPYSKTRSPKAVNVVRIVMSLDYLAENSPTVSIEDGTDQDAHYNQNYSYDLELDQNDTIVGGEWHNTLHPDFLWAPEKNSKATSVGDTWLERSNDQSKWSGREPLPALWKKAANLSSKNSQPLAKVVERLFQMVHEGR